MLKSLNDITDEDLTLIEEMAALYYTPKEICIIVELKYDEAKNEIEKEEGKFYEAFQRGRLQSETDLRRSILMLAKAGSSPAQTMAMDLLNKSKVKMLDL